MLKVSKVSSIRKHCQKSTTICSHNLIFHVDGWAVGFFFFFADEYAAMGKSKSKSKSYLIRPHGKLKNKVFCLTDMGTLFQYARGRGRHSRLASCIYLGLLLWFSAGTGLGIKLLVCTKWKCLPDPSLFSGCPMCQGWLERVTVLAWMVPFLWKNWDSVLEGGPSELKEASGNDGLRSLATKRRLRRSLNLWIPGHIRHFMTQGIFQSHKKDLRTRPWTHHSHCRKKSVNLN